MGSAVVSTLDAVLFEGGEVVGPDSTGMQAMLTAGIRGEQDVHKLWLRGDVVVEIRRNSRSRYKRRWLGVY
jgi:hypothetical protein